MIFDQAEYALRCEWGPRGIEQLAGISHVLIVVDVLSFSTAVDIAVENGAVVFPYGDRDEGLETYARTRLARIAEKVRTQSGFSLSPASLRAVPPEYRLVLPSPNGGALCLAGGTVGRRLCSAARTFTACLRNAGAVAAAARQCGSTFAVVPAGERWPDGSLRPAIEDWIGAGAVLARLPGTPSPEAALAIAAFESYRSRCIDLSRSTHRNRDHSRFGEREGAELLSGSILEQSISGKELIGRGFAEDVALAAEFDASTTAPVLRDGAFVKWRVADTETVSPGPQWA